MKLSEARSIIDDGVRMLNCPPGYMVHFEVREGGFLKGDYFPDYHSGEPLLETEEEAWKLANEFAMFSNPERYVNIYVVKGNFIPVDGYELKELRRYP